MTDTPAATGGPPLDTAPTISSNVRAEIARRGMTAAGVRRALADRGAPLPASTWDQRMVEPGTWRWRELTAIAEVLAVSPSVFVPVHADVPR